MVLLWCSLTYLYYISKLLSDWSLFRTTSHVPRHQSHLDCIIRIYISDYPCIFSRVVYRFGIFGRYSVGISRYLPYRYRRKIRSVHFAIKKGAVPPFFLKRGSTAPFLRSSTPFWKKGGRKGGKYTKRGGSIPTEIPKIQQIWYRQNTDTEKTAGNTAVSLIFWYKVTAR